MTSDSHLAKVERMPAETEDTRSGHQYLPSVDIIEKADELLLMADMPGAGPDDIDINYEKGELTISGKVAPRSHGSNSRLVMNEYGVGDFHRAFKIGEGINAEGIEAKVKDGVLTLVLPKAEKAKPRKIKVHGK